MKAKRHKVQITLPKDLLDALDQDAQETYLTRSSWFERAARFYIEKSNGERPKQRKLIDLDI